MNLDREQFCAECGDPTGRGGNFHDHLFVRVGDKEVGPLCDECADRLAKENNTEVIRR